MIALISIGKPDYDAIEIFREKQEFFTKAIGIQACPSSPTLRQRIDLIGQNADNQIKGAVADLIITGAPKVSSIHTSAGDFIPFDVDVSPFDNSKTQKEGVSRTYKGVDGYAPIFAYLGTEGYLVNLELREGKQHCQNNTPEFLDETLDYVAKITNKPILMRLDSGNDSKDNFPNESRKNAALIVKHNLRRESQQAWVELAKKTGQQKPCREGKSVWIGKTTVGIDGKPLPYPIVFEVTDLPGFFGALHTWGTRLQYHPHIHYLVAGGAYCKQSGQWRRTRIDFLLPVHAMSKIFKAKFKDRMIVAGLFPHIPATVWDQAFNVDCRAVAEGARSVTYLSKYLFKVAISDNRIVKIDDEKVHFKYRV